MRESTHDLKALDHIWRQFRDDMLATRLRLDQYDAQLAAGMAPNQKQWSWGGKALLPDAEKLMVAFRELAEMLAWDAQTVFANPAIKVRLDTKTIIYEYMDVKRPERWSEDVYDARRLVRLNSLSLEALWAQFDEAFPQANVEETARQQAVAEIHRSFREFRRWNNPGQVKRVKDRQVLTLGLACNYDRHWQIDYQRARDLADATEALANAFALDQQIDAASDLRFFKGQRLANRGCGRDWTYTSRERIELGDDLTLILFKEDVQFHVSNRLADAVKAVMADNSQAQGLAA